MATINILIVVNGDALKSLVERGKIGPGTPTSPTSLASVGSSEIYISMIASNSPKTGNTHNNSEFYISADAGDTLDWSITTLNNNLHQTPYLYSGIFNPSSGINTPMSFLSIGGDVYLAEGDPVNDTPTKFINQKNSVSGTVLEVDLNIQYALFFSLVNNVNGKIIGYFRLDSFILVN